MMAAKAAEALRDGMEVIIAGDFNDMSASVPDAGNNLPLSSVLEHLQVLPIYTTSGCSQ